MNNKLLQLSVLLFTILLTYSCEDDTAFSGPMEYDPTRHVQGTALDFWGYAQRGYSWEVIMDIETGQFDTIPGTGELTGGYNSPIGPDRLTDFENNRRIYINNNDSGLVIQDMNSSEKRYFEILDPDTGDGLHFRLNLEFGNHSNELFAYNQNAGKIFRIDLEDESIEVVTALTLTDINSVSDFIFIKESQQIILFGLSQNSLAQNANHYAIYDLTSNSVVEEGNIPNTFGFVKHPTKNSIFCLTVPTTEAGFRLIELQKGENGLTEITLSQEDLEISSISTHRSTIHSATDSYVVRGGSNHESNPETILYRIDLERGELKAATYIDNKLVLLKLAGE